MNDNSIMAEHTVKGRLQLIECPRDAMQGWKTMIATSNKIRYLQTLLKVGFDTIDFGSFVSPKAIPQMADTKEVIRELDISDTSTKLLAIVANERGAEEAASYNAIHYLGFPFSISPTFQMRNTNSTQEESLGRLASIQNICQKNAKQLVVYLSMGFGNPYGDPYNEEILFLWANKMTDMGIQILSLADTVGVATPQQISTALNTLIPQYPSCCIGVHLHSTSENWKEKLDAAFAAGCLRFDGALKGIGGCPMADDELVGNMNTELMIPFFQSNGLLHSLNQEALRDSLSIASEIFV